MKQPILSLICAGLIFYTLLQTALAAEPADHAPNCTLTSIEAGEQFNLAKYRGKVLYVDFWASWCTPCIKSFPLLNRFNEEFKSQGLQIVGVNLDESPEDAKEFLAKTPAQFMLANDSDQQCAKAFNVRAMPSSYLIDRNGVIRGAYLGFHDDQIDKFRSLLRQLLAETAASDIKAE